MGSKTRKAQCTTLYVCDSSTEERSIQLRSILGVLPCLILRIWRLRTRTKDEYMMDDFSMLTIREPWLLKRKVSTFTVSTWLAGKGIDAARSSWFTARDQLSEISNRSLQRKKANDRVPQAPVRKVTSVGTSRNNLAHTFTHFANFWGFDNSLFWKCTTFQSWRDAYAGAVWRSWCTLEWLGYPCALVIARAIKVAKGSVWRGAISQPRYLARS
jgi:hypothetical protein